jgi:hypothetical protein
MSLCLLSPIVLMNSAAYIGKQLISAVERKTPVG